MDLRRVGRFVLCSFAVSGLSAAPLRALEWRIVSESADHLRLRVEVRVPAPERIGIELDGRRFTRFDLPDAYTMGSPGAPELLVASRLLAVPPGAQASLQILELELRESSQVAIVPRPWLRVGYGPEGSPEDPSSGFAEEHLTYDPQAYLADGARTEAVRLGNPSRLRHLSVVPVEVAPILYDPATQQARVVQRLVFEVALGRGREKAGWGDALQARRVTPLSWERIYDHTVLNAAAGREWMRTPPRQERLGKPLESGLLRPGLLNEEEWKLRVGRTGAVRVPAAVLLGAGFPDGTPVERLRLVLKRFDPAAPLEARILEIPLHVEDNGDSLFRSGDGFVFYAEHPRDDTSAGERAARYSFTNVYWLSVADTGTPLRMPVRPFTPGGTPGPATFSQDLVVEEDRAMNEWIFGDDEELYFLLDRASLDEGKEARWDVAVPGRAPGALLEVCVDTQQDYLRRAFELYAQLPSGRRLPLGSSPGVPPSASTPPPRLVLCGEISGADMEPGNIAVILRAVNLYDVPDTTPFVDNIRLRYTASYRAEADRIRCTSGGATGPTDFVVNGFSGTPLYAFDVTDRKQPALFDLTGALANGTLTLTDDVPAGGMRHYEVVPRASLLTLGPANVERPVPDPLLEELAAPLGAYDVLVVAHDSFAQAPKLLEWKMQRESQGYRVRIVATSVAYDAFNGGLLHYEPLYALVRAAYDNWGIGFVLLVGDGSEDAAGLLPTSGPNFVPDRVRYFWVAGSSGGGGQHRNDLYERYYAKMDGDRYPDLLIGRLPVGNAVELGNVVDKILRYENPAADDDGRWRKRVLVFSDDEWVRRTVDGGIVHIRGCSEWGFFRSIRRCCETVDGAWPGDLQCVPFYVHELSNRLAEPSPVGQNIAEHQAWPIDSLAIACGDTTAYHRPHRGALEFVFYEGAVGRALTDSVGDGVLMFALQSHANRAVVTDEGIIRRTFDPGSPFQPDFRNHGKPFIFFGFGCHLNEFGVLEEDRGTDCLGELYLNVPERGAVASYASTGFEYLGENNDFHENMWRMIFEKRYFRTLGGGSVNSDTLEADWQLGALLQIAEISNVRLVNPPPSQLDMIDRYCLLGDPLLRLDAGLARFRVLELENAVLFEDGRLVVRDAGSPVRFSLAVADEQGIDSLWVERRFLDGRRLPVDGVVATASIDTAQQVTAKRGYRLDFSLLFDSCDFELVVGARDRAGRVGEFVARAQPEQSLSANGLVVTSGSQVDRRANFRYVLEDCVPDSTLQLAVLLDEQPLEFSLATDSLFVTWVADFAWDVAGGMHRLRFLRGGLEIYAVDLVVGSGLGMHDVLAFPNPFARKTHFFFNLESEIASGMLRIMDLNGRTVRQFDLRDPGVLQALLSEPPAGLGTTMAMNYVEWDGTDSAGGAVANGVYFYELRLADPSGREVRKRDKVVVMR